MFFVEKKQTKVFLWLFRSFFFNSKSLNINTLLLVGIALCAFVVSLYCDIMHLWPNARTHTRFFRGRSELVWILATYFFRLFPPEGLWRWNALRSLVPPSSPLAEFRRGGRSCWRERERELGTLGTFLHSLIAPRAVVKWHKAPARVDPPLIFEFPSSFDRGEGGVPLQKRCLPFFYFVCRRTFPDRGVCLQVPSSQVFLINELVSFFPLYIMNYFARF